MFNTRRVMVAAGALVLAFPMAASAAKQAKVDICHWDEDAQLFKVISVSGNAVDSHFANHGDVTPGTWYTDADGDGYGDPAGATDPCPNAGFVNNNGDCNDADAAINPGAEEVCGDQIDNNCSGEADEGCSSCPCFSTADLDAANAEYLADVANNAYNYRGCDDVSYNEDSYYWYWYYNYNYVHVWFHTYNDYYSGNYQYKYKQFYSIDYDDYYEQTYCVNYQYEYPNYDYSSYEFQYITEAEHEQCKDLLRNWAGANGLTCNVYNY